MSEPRGLSAEVMAATMAAQGHVAKAKRWFRDLVGLKRAYRRIFTDKSGQLTREGRMVLADMIRASGMDTATRDLDGPWLAQREGQRMMVLHIFGRLRMEDSRLDQLENELNQAMEDEDQ